LEINPTANAFVFKGIKMKKLILALGILMIQNSSQAMTSNNICSISVPCYYNYNFIGNATCTVYGSAYASNYGYSGVATQCNAYPNYTNLTVECHGLTQSFSNGMYGYLKTDAYDSCYAVAQRNGFIP
jgi:hypothetical protein